MDKLEIIDGTGKDVSINQDDFSFVQNHEKIHDVKLKSKPTTFFKDAIKRFTKSKSAVVGGAIVGVLLLFSLIVPVCTPEEGVYSTTPGIGGKPEENFLPPKLFPTGTGFWDGTVHRDDIVFDTKNNVPAGYSEDAISNVVTTVRSQDIYSEYGVGGYLNVTANNANSNGTFVSPTFTISPNTNYDLSFKLVPDQLKANYEMYGYNLAFVTEAKEETPSKTYYLLGNQETFVNDTDVSKLNVVKTLTDAQLSLNEPVSGNFTFTIKNGEKTGSLPIESFKIETNSKEEEILNDVKNISFKDGNEVAGRSAGHPGMWSGISEKNPTNVQITYASFTYDPYMAVYGKREQLYGDRQVQLFERQHDLKVDFSNGTKATKDPKILKERFKIIDPENGPIVEIVEQVGDATVNPMTGAFSGFQLKCKVMNYKILGYDKMPSFVFGTNKESQDYFKLIFTGLRFSLLLAIGVSFVNILIGLTWGSISGYFGGATDIIMERICDILSGLPLTVLITLCILYGNQLNWGSASDVIALMLALFLTGWMGVAHQTRTQFYRFKGREYVLASRTLGAKDGRLIFRHILPNAAGTIITGSVLIIPNVIYTEASIAYLGLGLKNQTLFGVILAGANQYYKGEQSFLLFIPTFIMMLLLISFNLFGNGLRDAFNPQLKGSE